MKNEIFQPAARARPGNPAAQPRVMLDELINKNIIPDADGRNVFFPCGALGKGYIISTRDQEIKVRNFMSVQWIIFILSCVIIWILKLMIIIMRVRNGPFVEIIGISRIKSEPTMSATLLTKNSSRESNSMTRRYLTQPDGFNAQGN